MKPEGSEGAGAGEAGDWEGGDACLAEETNIANGWSGGKKWKAVGGWGIESIRSQPCKYMGLCMKSQ